MFRQVPKSGRPGFRGVFRCPAVLSPAPGDGKIFRNVSTFSKLKREGGGTMPPGPRWRKNCVFPRNDRPYGLKHSAFQTENALRRCCQCPNLFPWYKRAGEGMGGLGGRETPLARAEGFPFPPEKTTYERKNRVFPRNDRPYGLKRNAFQTENVPSPKGSS